MGEPTETDLRLHFLELEGVLDRIERASTHYQVLGVERSATSDEISRAQRRTMSILSSPDSKHPSLPPDFSRRINKTVKEVVKAHMVLGNYGSRVEYDNSFARRRTPIPLPIDLGTTSMRPPSRPVVETKSDRQTSVQTRPESPAVITSDNQRVAAQVPGKTSAPSRGTNQDAIAINHSSARVLFTKSAKDCKDADKRRYQRLKLSIPTYVVGYDETHGKWTEVGHTLDVSIGGLSVQLAREMAEAAVVHLTLPMPTKLRRHGYSDPTYQVYAIVRRVKRHDEKQYVVGLEFLGASPPPGYLQKPWARFHTTW